MSVEIKRQYQKWPYPDIPLLASIGREQLWQINVTWMLQKAGLEPPRKPKIWIAGCGTFQPYLFSQANPNSEILATDISETSLLKARLRCRLHLKQNVSFEEINLEDPKTLPEGPFDFIECYGVLMNLKDPSATLVELKKRLSPNGLIRIMVYPHYGRQKIFQIQRLATLLKFSREDKRGPKRFRKLMLNLPVDHPLREAFLKYNDSKNDAGVVDAFLHAGDRAFTGIEICQMIEAAGLSLAYTMHRPWGDPLKMREKLNLENKDYGYLLNYLDVWQSLRSNFILCLKKNDAIVSSPVKPHPLFSFATPKLGFRYRTRLARMALTGVKLQTRTYDGAKDLKAGQVRQLLKGNLLDGERVPALEPLMSLSSRNIKPSLHWGLREGDFAPNPLYAHFFDVLRFKEGNYQDLMTERFSKILQASDTVLEKKAISFSESGIRISSSRKREVYSFIDDNGLTKTDWTDGELLELWCLLFSYKDLFWKD